jgi:hypothetical protein
LAEVYYECRIIKRQERKSNRVSQFLLNIQFMVIDQDGLFEAINPAPVNDL